MRVVLTGGGSGGHIYPALAIARGLMAENPNHRILYIGTRHGLEHDLVPRAGISFRTIHARGLLVKGWRGKIAGAGALAAGIRDAWSILRRERPDVVVGTGGYVSGPVGLVASWLKIPLVIQEQNAFPGLTNRTLARRAYAVVTPWEEARQYFPSHTRVVLAGNPVQVTTTHTRESARVALGLDPKIRVLMVTGGSQGAAALNAWVTELLPELHQATDWGIIWATGSRYYETVKNAVDPVIGHLPPSRFRMEPYFLRDSNGLSSRRFICRPCRGHDDCRLPGVWGAGGVGAVATRVGKPPGQKRVGDSSPGRRVGDRRGAAGRTNRDDFIPFKGYRTVVHHAGGDAGALRPPRIRSDFSNH